MPDLNRWLARAPMPTARADLGCATLGGKLYAIGGSDYVQYLSSVEVYDTLADSWTYETSMEYARQSAALGLIPNRIYVVGGWNGHSVGYNEEGRVPVSIEDEKGGLARSVLTVRSNPSRGRICAELSASPGNLQGGVIRVLDVCGREVRRVNLPDRIRYRIWLKLPAGVFYFCLENSNTRLRTKVMVIE